MTIPTTCESYQPTRLNFEDALRRDTQKTGITGIEEYKSKNNFNNNNKS